MVGAFVALAATGEVALFVGALAAVEDKFWLHGPVGTLAWVARGATDHGSCFGVQDYIDTWRTAAGIWRQLVVGTPVGGELAVGIALTVLGKGDVISFLTALIAGITGAEVC